MTETKRAYRSWSRSDKAKIVAEAVRIARSRSDLRLSQLIRLAQQVLDPDLQRQVLPVNTESYHWFRDGLRKGLATPPPPEISEPVKIEIVRAPEEPQPVLASPEQVVVNWAGPLDSPAPTDRRPSPLLRQDAPTGTTLELLSAVVEALQENRQAMIDVGRKLDRIMLGLDVRDDVRQHGKDIDKLLAVTLRIGQAVDTFSARLDRAQVGGASPELRRLPGGVRPKPRCLVLGLQSGHAEQHVRAAAGASCEVLDYKLVNGEPLPYRNYDLIFVTKKVPTDWITRAKAGVIEPHRLVNCPGNAGAVAERVKAVADEWRPQPEEAVRQRKEVVSHSR